MPPRVTDDPDRRAAREPEGDPQPAALAAAEDRARELVGGHEPARAAPVERRPEAEAPAATRQRDAADVAAPGALRHPEAHEVAAVRQPLRVARPAVPGERRGSCRVKRATSRLSITRRPRDCWKTSTLTGAATRRAKRDPQPAAARLRRDGAEARGARAGGRRGRRRRRCRRRASRPRPGPGRDRPGAAARSSRPRPRARTPAAPRRGRPGRGAASRRCPAVQSEHGDRVVLQRRIRRRVDRAARALVGEHAQAHVRRLGVRHVEAAQDHVRRQRPRHAAGEGVGRAGVDRLLKSPSSAHVPEHVRISNWRSAVKRFCAPGSSCSSPSSAARRSALTCTRSTSCSPPGELHGDLGRPRRRASRPIAAQLVSSVSSIRRSRLTPSPRDRGAVRARGAVRRHRDREVDELAAPRSCA